MKKRLVFAMALLAGCGAIPSTLDVDGGSYSWMRRDVTGDIHLTVEHYSGPAVNVYLVNKVNFNNFQNGYEFSYYTACSREAMRTSFECTMTPADDAYYVIVQNNNFFSTAQVQVQFFTPPG